MAQPPENPIMDARVKARRQKELDGFLETYQGIIDARAAAYSKDLLPTYQKMGNYLEDAIRQLYKDYAVDGILPEMRSYELERLLAIQKHLLWLQSTVEPQQTLMTNNLAFQYADAYYFNAFAVEQAAKVAVLVPILSESQVMGVLANPWLPDGFTYADRLRANTAFLGQKMRENVTRAIAEGLSVNETARNIQEAAGETYSNSVRLARTELNRAASQGATQLYMQNADIMGEKKWNATLDSRTAPKDADNDGKLYPLDYDTPETPGKPGERIPNHPNCRCKYSPQLAAFSGESVKERIARGEGDTPQNFGERTYTKAKNYREYAKERGLPDLDERLRNDNPRRYLRRGETMDDYNQ